MIEEFPCSPYKTVKGLAYFSRMLDKIRLHEAGTLPKVYHKHLGVDFDGRCLNFLHVKYADVRKRVLAGNSDEQVLEWCFENGKRPTEEELEIWSDFMRKRGWRDEASDRIAFRLEEAGLEYRDLDAVTMFDFIDLDEGRKPPDFKKWEPPRIIRKPRPRDIHQDKPNPKNEASASEALKSEIKYTYIDSALGRLLVLSRENKLAGLYFADQKHTPPIGRDWLEQPDVEIFARTQKQLDEYAEGKRQRFDLPLAELHGTPFQVRVWKEIAAIPFGKIITYSELAERVGLRRANRATGTVTGRNPLCWIIPCHRVMRRDNQLTGYAGGIDRKQALLEFELAKAEGQDVVLTYGQSPVAA